MRVESLLAAAAALVGVVALVSGLTPEFADRSRLIRGVLPPGFPEIARVLDAGSCPRADRCAARDVWCDVASAVNGVLSGLTLDQLSAKQRAKADESPSYCI